MDFKEAIKSLTEKFSSGNDVEVERSTILRTEWGAIKAGIDVLKGCDNCEYEESCSMGNMKQKATDDCGWQIARDSLKELKHG